MQKLEKYIIPVLTVCVLALFGVAFSNEIKASKQLKDLEARSSELIKSLGGNLGGEIKLCNKGYATTTRSTIGAIASTTMECDIREADNFVYNWIAEASSTARVCTDVAFSHNKVDWFDAKGITVVNNEQATVGNKVTTYCSNLGSSATSTGNLEVGNTVANFVRITTGSSATSSIWDQVSSRSTK